MAFRRSRTPARARRRFPTRRRSSKRRSSARRAPRPGRIGYRL